MHRISARVVRGSIALAILFVAAHGQPPAARAQIYPNILVIIADDLGVEQLASYGVGADPATTPTLDDLAEEGLLFHNVWSNPLCSTTRATLQTGLYSFRTGIGGKVDTDEIGLRLDLEFTLADLVGLSPGNYTRAAFGKWHLNGELYPDGWGYDAVRASGFDHFEGTMRNLQVFFGGSYFSYEKVLNGVVSDVDDGYVTSDTVDWALDFLLTAPEPWFAYVAFHAPHQPFHLPPADLADTSGCIDGQSGDESACFKAMIEAMDTEIGRLLATLDPERPLVVIFLGDNGTDATVAEPPFTPEHAKGSLWEGGINVPLIVWSPGLVVAGESEALVNTTDLFATIGELVDVEGPDFDLTDSVSLAPYLLDEPHPSPRARIFAEVFTPNGCHPTTQFGLAIRDERFKLIKVPAHNGGGEEFFDLRNDRWETKNLLPDLNPPQLAAYTSFRQTLEDLVVGVGDPCTQDRDCCSRLCEEGRCR